MGVRRNMLKKDSFSFALTSELFDNLDKFHSKSNWDEVRFGKLGAGSILKNRVMRWVNRGIKFTGYGIQQHDKVRAKYRELVDIYGEGLDSLYSMLDDPYSQSALVEIIAYRILGYEHMRLWTNNLEYWQARDKAYSIPLGEGKVSSGNPQFPLSLIDLRKIGYEIELYSHPLVVAHQFLLGHYGYQQGEVKICVENGDYVIDAGSAWGETALLFASDAGEGGKVFSFDINRENMGIFKKNISHNNLLKDRISLHSNAVWHQSGEILTFDAAGAGTRISDCDKGGGAEQVESIAIDDFASSLPKVDFIKMDVEGAELSALKGAEKTIVEKRPKLAISLYHNIKDFVEIPEYLTSLDVDYEYYLDHSTIHQEETVLFARARG